MEINRTFGVELEVGFENDDYRQLVREKLPGNIQMVRDGSIDETISPVEIVTPVLRGEEGCQIIEKVCSVLNDNHVISDNATCSVHVHIGAHDYLQDKHYELVKDSEPVSGRAIARISKRDAEILSTRTGNAIQYDVARICSSIQGVGTKFFYGRGVGDRDFMVYGGKVPTIFSVKRDELNNIVETGKSELSEEFLSAKMKLRRNMLTLVETEELEPFYKIKNLFYFYTLFSDVMQSMVPDSRKIRNAYCVPLEEVFTLDEIESCESYDEIKRLWYRESSIDGVERRVRNKRDDSRYHDINLHSLWYRYGTIEVRSHPPTTDHMKILLWVELHDSIIQKIGNGVDLKDMIALKDIKDISEKTRAMIGFLGLNRRMERYVKRLVEHYTLLKQPI